MPTEKIDTTKPPMPEEGIIGTLPAMKLKLLNDIEHFSGGRTCPVFEGRKVHDGDKELGDISAEVAGRGLQVHVNGPNGKGRAWFLSSEDVFAAALEADAKYMERHTKGPRERRASLRFREIERRAAKAMAKHKKDGKS